VKIIILAGGSGTRLWPISRGSFPKQFLKLGDELSLLQKTVKRFWGAFDLKDLLILTNQECYHLVKSQITFLDPGFEKRILVEPARKNTAPAIAYALKYLQECEQVASSTVVLISPSDHLITPEKAFLETLPKAELAAVEGSLVTFGVRPNKAETGYGYIEVENDKVARFIEKPTVEKAEEYLAAGNYLWNSGMFAFSIATFWQELHQHALPIFELMQSSFSEIEFSLMPEISIDYAIMEASKNLAVIPLHLTWSDIGSWDSVFDMMKKDENQNVKIGNVYDVDTKNSLIYGGKRLISTIGLEDVIIIETEDALFLGKKGNSQAVKKIVEELKRQGKKESFEHRTIQRPWGSYTILEEGPRYKVKRITVEPHQRLSLQWHHHRSEHWVVIKGRAKVTIGDKEQMIEENQSIYVPKKGIHRLENPTDSPLELIEVQVGEYVGEDDIVRVEDVYGRVLQK
jgi:mannose-1-phosphate guanylyltransferase/mannose-6-phosphate isomerase